ncbi:ionotropic receptor 40a [Episyrphus balteatus]|uniref:ionotropic receptor 40a n=1 Tax=Episyrphus balteatus TaxID=286459 RepID=UPI002486909D|nr:ionotropic receptor 40a [Episyrphus balteatus]
MLYNLQNMKCISQFKSKQSISSVIMKILLIFICLFCKASGLINFTFSKNATEVSIGLAEIINGLNPSQLAIFIDCTYQFDEIDEFVYLIHKRYYKSVVFYDNEQYFQFIENGIHSSIESFSLIFGKPFDLAKQIHKRKLAHRLNLFIFYWGAKRAPKDSDVQFEEPMRAVVITRPRNKAFRIYYSQDSPTESGKLKLVNWFDAESLGLYHTPLLPSSAMVYSNLAGRVLRVPVFHSPPWFWVNYENDTVNFEEWDYDTDLSLDTTDYREVNVTGGRDHRLLTLLATSMNFNFVYIDTPGRTQGSLRTDDESNTSFTGGIGLLQERRAHLLLGDVSLSWERRRAVEFSFFTLSDSGAFVTHAPRRLNEALAVLRPFKKDVWPYLILTLVLSGPMLYMIIAIPYKLSFQKNKFGKMLFYAEYLNEITPISPKITADGEHQERNEEMPMNLLDRCIWFTVQLFLKQSCSEPYNGYRAKFLMIVFWISATYVLADVYSAQLTSQFARPAHEQPINNLQKLHRAILRDGYRLYVEKDSSSLEMLQNGTEIFRNLYALMKQQVDYEGYLIDSVESGIKLIADGLENKVVMGGRETLYFNMKQFGFKTFQLSQKLYTRYSAVAVQLGCPFLDSLNNVLIRLFEGGILDKMTNAEYEALSRLVNVKGLMKKFEQQDGTTNNAAAAADNNKENKNNKNESSDYIIQPINLRMLQGAFIALSFGWAFAGGIFLFEIFFGSKYFVMLKRQNVCLEEKWKKFKMFFKFYWKRYFINLVRFLYNKRK